MPILIGTLVSCTPHLQRSTQYRIDLAGVPLGIAISDFVKKFSAFERVPISDGSVVFQRKEQWSTIAVMFDSDFKASAVFVIAGGSPSTDYERRKIIDDISQQYGNPEISSDNGSKYVWTKDGQRVVIHEFEQGAGYIATVLDSAYPSFQSMAEQMVPATPATRATVAAPAAQHEQIEQRVAFNTSTLKYHGLSCKWAIKCTGSCISVPLPEAKKRGGVPCKVCGGR